MRFIGNYGRPFAYDLINYYIFSSLGRSHHKETNDLTSHPGTHVRKLYSSKLSATRCLGTRGLSTGFGGFEKVIPKNAMTLPLVQTSFPTITL